MSDYGVFLSVLFSIRTKYGKKNGPEKLYIWTCFMQCSVRLKFLQNTRFETKHLPMEIRTVQKLIKVMENASVFNLFVPNVPFLCALMFAGGRERVHWEQMG